MILYARPALPHMTPHLSDIARSMLGNGKLVLVTVITR